MTTSLSTVHILVDDPDAALAFRADDLAETFARVASVPGVEVLSEPASQPWGVRDAAVRDPAGNRIRIEQS
jgi:catechol 2,3-dioxygenase-like lactoylglutathione lyase family enzyme